MKSFTYPVAGALCFLIFLNQAIGQELPTFACTPEQAPSASTKIINCNSLHSVADSLQEQFDYTVQRRLGHAETACGEAYISVLNAIEEEKPASRVPAGKLLSKCNKAILETAN